MSRPLEERIRHFIAGYWLLYVTSVEQIGIKKGMQQGKT